ncbi:rhodanese-like domain-containing protein [Sphingomonas sp.]|uniref:rhodanese-like domain-containing protein n=1 Tax=Sphingomonas sp. TaxID=28214 RepID=UPI001ED2539A|nr:rhodanese-like domain-containing protein [Sphingomonas sp.]MBX3593353.1 rhodanese-like domain-containing protein [Sphingomonas sp.]
MFGFGSKPAHAEIGPHELDAMLRDGAATVIDVREVDEFAAGHIPGAINVPLSRFDPAALPDAGGRRRILNCAGGKRSAMALDRCATAQAAIDTHLAGGFGAWKAAGLPVER